jgi:hypothetical protein
MAEIYQLPENGNNNGSIPFSIPIGMGNGFGGGFGSFNSIADLFGLAIIASMFGWGNGGWGGGFGGWGGNAGGAGFLSNQLNNDSGRELIMNAITSQGEASRSAIQNLATTLGQDFNLVNSAVQNVQNALATLAAQQGMSTLQIVNAIQAGDASLASQFQKCCCDNQLAICQQTNALQSQADRNANSILNAINAQTVAMDNQFCALKERELQSKIDTQADIITQLRGQIDNANQTNQIIGYVNTVVSPLQTKLTEIENKMPNTVPVQYPNLVAVNNTPYSGGYYGGYYGNNFGGNIVF